jgi:hypothetical protein
MPVLAAPASHGGVLPAWICQEVTYDRIQPQRMPLTARMWLLDIARTPARFSGPGLMTQVASMPNRAACQTRTRVLCNFDFRACAAALTIEMRLR